MLLFNPNIRAYKACSKTAPPGDKGQKIYNSNLHITAENNFQDMRLRILLEPWVFGGTWKIRWDHLPRGVDAKYMYHVKKQDTFSQQCKASQYEKPIHTTKKVPPSNIRSMGYENIHVIFQLTEKTNVHCVNALSKCSLCVWQNDRGRGENKRKWDIKTNKDFNFYISNYNVIESLDHLIYSFKLFYNGWKFWHAPMQHGMAMAMVAVFSMYQECCEGKLDAN